ncbi:hypothetical protein [Rhodococcus sp. NPDC003348]
MAIVGSVFASRLATLLPKKLGSHDVTSLRPASVNALPDAARAAVLKLYNAALPPIFLCMVPLASIAVVALLFREEKPLIERIERSRIIWYGAED